MRRAAVAMSLSSSGEWTGAVGDGNIKSAQNDGSRALEKADGGTGQGHEDQHGRGNGQGQSLGAAQGQRLGDQFADHYIKVGDQGKAEDHGGHRGHMGIGLGMGLSYRQSAEPAHQNRSGQRLAQPAEGQRAERDAKLHGGQKVVQILLQAAHRACSRNAGGAASARCACREWRPGQIRRPQKMRWPE